MYCTALVQAVFQAHQELKRDVVKMLALQRAVMQAEAEVAVLYEQRNKLADTPLPTAKPQMGVQAPGGSLGSCCTPFCMSV